MDHGFAMLNNQSLFFPFSPILCFPRNHHVFFHPVAVHAGRFKEFSSVPLAKKCSRKPST